MKALLLENISAVAVQVFRDAGYEVESLKVALEERELIEKIRGASILGVRSKTRVSPDVLKAAQNLVAVGAFCIGVEKIDCAASSERGIAVFNDPHSNSRSVAELVMGEIIMLLRRTFAVSTQMHSGVWNKSAAGAHEVRGLTLGIVGYGKIGSQLSDLAEAMGMRVVFYDVSHVLARGQRASGQLSRTAGDVGCGHAARGWQAAESESVWRGRIRGDERRSVLPESESRVCRGSRRAGGMPEVGQGCGRGDRCVSFRTRVGCGTSRARCGDCRM